jgi:hypothetical protein
VIRFVITKGQHMSLPRKPKYWLTQVEGEFFFPQEAIYDLGDVDQYDWNKLTGISSNPFKPDQNAVMIGWRWNPALSLFEVGPYFNRDSARIMPKENQILRLRPHEVCGYRVTFDAVHVFVPASGATVREEIKVKTPDFLRINRWTCFRIQPWFGGNERAPEDLPIYLSF